MKKKIVTLLIILSICTAYAFAADVSEQEVAFYAAQKYKVNYYQQTQKSKDDIKNEYIRISKIADAAMNEGIKDEIAYQVATKIIAVDLWSQKYMSTVTVSDEDLHKIFDAAKLKVPTRYKLDNILVADEKQANKAMLTISAIKENSKKLQAVTSMAKANATATASKDNAVTLGWVDINKVNDITKKALNGRKTGDVVKVPDAKIGWHVLYVEEVSPEHVATFEEAKPTLTNIAKENALTQKAMTFIK